MFLRSLLVAILIYSPAFAHDWYDRSCCSEKDCRPVTEGEVTTVPGKGYRVYIPQSNGMIVDEIIPFSSKAIRPSQDGGVHVCIPYFSRRVRCLYIPTGV